MPVLTASTPMSSSDAVELGAYGVDRQLPVALHAQASSAR